MLGVLHFLLNHKVTLYLLLWAEPEPGGLSQLVHALHVALSSVEEMHCRQLAVNLSQVLAHIEGGAGNFATLCEEVRHTRRVLSRARQRTR